MMAAFVYRVTVGYGVHDDDLLLVRGSQECPVSGVLQVSHRAVGVQNLPIILQGVPLN